MKTFLSTILAVMIFSGANLPVMAEENPDKETGNQAVSEDKSEVDEENPYKSGKAKIGGRNINAYSRKQGQIGTTAIGGYFDTEYYFPSNKPSFFDQHRLILQASSLFSDRIFFNTEIEFEHGGLINAGTNDGELKIEQAWLDYKIEDWMIVRAGAVLIPLGRLNVLHDSDYRDTTARPLFNSVIMPTTWMEPGAGLYGTMYPNDDWELNYEAYVSQGLIDGLSDGNGLRKTRPSLSKDNNGGKAVSGRFGLSPFIGLDFGLGGYYSTYDAGDLKHLGLFVADFSYTLGAFELVGEGGFSAFSPSDVKDTAGKVTGTLNGPMWGYYLEAHYHLFPEFMKNSFLGRDFDNPVFTLFSRIDQVDTNVEALNVNDRTQLCFGFNYRPLANVAFKFEYQWNIENEAILRNDPSKELNNNQFIASVAAGF